MSGACLVENSPSVISAMSKEVPPMSVQAMFPTPIRSLRNLLPTTPPIGPLIIVRASSRALIEIVPPWLAMILSSKRPPAPRQISWTTWRDSRDGSAA